MRFAVVDTGDKGLAVVESKREGQWEVFNQSLCEGEIKLIRMCLLAWGWQEVKERDPKALFVGSSAGYYDACVKGWLGSRGKG